MPLLPIADATGIATGIAAFATIGWFLYLLVGSDAAWLHPEVLGSSAYIWIAPGQESLGAMLRKIFDWKAFDPNVNRVRPLNDAFEVIDAIARPYITLLIGIQASLNISTVLTAVAAPLLLFGGFRRIVAASIPAIVLTLVFISTTGFLSLTVAYLHPAKKLNLIFLCAALYFAERMRNGENGRNAAWLALSLVASFFSDELGLGNFVLIGIIYWRELVADWRRVALFVALPVLFVVATKWGLPALYGRFSVHGPWDAFNDPKKLAVFSYLLDVEFYRACAEQLARSILSTVGISLHTGATAIATLVVLIGIPAVHVFRSGPLSIAAVLRDRLVLATIALILLNGYATLLDWYPFPNEISYLGSFNYYYHSSMAVVVLIWLAFALQAFRIDRSPALMLAAAAVIAISNFVIFRNVNELVKIIHYYPRSRDTIFAALQKGTLAGLLPDPVGQEADFDAAAKIVFSARWQQNGFYLTHRMLVDRNIFIMDEEHLKHLLHAYRPWTK